MKWACATFGALTVVVLILVGGADWLHTEPAYSLEATACVEVRGTAISEMVRARSTASALETRLAGVSFMDVTPDAMLDARLSVAETQVAKLEEAALEAAAVLAAVLGDATPWPTYTFEPEPTETPTAMPTATPRPTWTPEPSTFTPTPTVTPAPLCHSCGASDRTYNCPSGWWCKEIRSGMWRCVSNANPSSDAVTCLKGEVAAMPMPVESTTWSLPEWSEVGMETFYTDTITTSGEPFMPDGFTCAVDESVYGMLEGLTLRITNLVDGRWVLVYVNDSGRLYTADPIQGYRVVVDVPYAIAKRIGDANTTLVRVAVEHRDNLTSVQKVVQ